MGHTLGDVLADMKDFEDSVYYYLLCIGYQPTDIENILGDLKQKLMEAAEYAEGES